MHLRSIIRRSDRQLWCPLQAETAILNTASGIYYGLDPVGARVWELLDAPISLAAINGALVTEFDVAPQRAEEDLRRFLGELAEAGLVEIQDEPTEVVFSSPRE